MIRSVNEFIKNTPLIDVYIFLKGCFIRPVSQSDESLIVQKLARRFNVPHTFVEFGFSGWEFNCASLITEWSGLLIDADPYNVKIANIICSNRVLAKRLWLTLDNLDSIHNFIKSRDLGVLSIDVDGNDYWFLENLIKIKPFIIVTEYNSSFGLRPVTVPYDPNFDRRKKDESGTYYGASLSAINNLANRNGYSLIEVSNNGVNAFFVRKDLLTVDDIELKPDLAFREKYFLDGSRPSQQWAKIKHLAFVDVTKTS